jgi:DNA-binding response OmpR family regulator
MRILLVEDEKDLQILLKKRLTQSGYGVDTADDGLEANYYLKTTTYDVVILDWMLPKMDGISLLRKLRQQEVSPPVLLLTAKDSIENRVEGLDAGADDYLIKPFAFEELLARLRVLVRRKTDIQCDTISIADLIVNFSTRKVIRGGKQILLSGREFAMLEYMLHNKGIILSRDKIEQHIWSYDFEGASNIVNVYIRYLRQKIDDGFEPKLIHTIRGSGYVLQENL